MHTNSVMNQTSVANRIMIALALLLASSALSASDPKRVPNFIFILSDDIAQGDMGAYGQTLIQTPRLDQMAAEGTRYLQAYCGTSVCAPSRSSFFTGLHTGHCLRAGETMKSRLKGSCLCPMPRLPLPRWRNPRGYATATFGKWGGWVFFDTQWEPQ